MIVSPTDTYPIGEISTVFSEWLDREIADSDTGRNKYLNDFDHRMKEFHMDFKDSANTSASKARNHHFRMNRLIGLYRDQDYRTANQTIAKMGHHGLMFVAGAFRTESYLLANSADEYVDYRHSHGSTSANVQEAVEHGIGQIKGHGEEGLESVLGLAQEANDQAIDLHRSVWMWLDAQGNSTLPLASEDSAPARAMKEVQRSWIGVVAAHTIVAAELKEGNLDQVPFFEPRSITDANIYFPFAA